MYSEPIPVSRSTSIQPTHEPFPRIGLGASSAIHVTQPGGGGEGGDGGGDGGGGEGGGDGGMGGAGGDEGGGCGAKHMERLKASRTPEALAAAEELE